MIKFVKKKAILLMTMTMTSLISLSGCMTTEYLVKDKPVTIGVEKSLFTGCKKPMKIEEVIGVTIDKATDDQIAMALANEHLEHIACYQTVTNAYKTLKLAEDTLKAKYETNDKK